jgi:hypothetical protein
MSTYLQDFNAAIKRSADHKLKAPSFQHEPTRKYLQGNQLEKLAFALQYCMQDLDDEQLNARCHVIHHRFAPLSGLLGCSALYTLGWIDDENSEGLYRGFDDSFIAAALESKHKYSGKAMDFHAWLTLPSMEIIDLTLATTYAVNNKTNDGRRVLMLGPPESFFPLTYKPMLVGVGFLDKLGISYSE